jgi:hypothetical protein
MARLLRRFRPVRRRRGDQVGLELVPPQPQGVFVGLDLRQQRREQARGTRT